jgi:hypothetical protein
MQRLYQRRYYEFKFRWWKISKDQKITSKITRNLTIRAFIQIKKFHSHEKKSKKRQ